MGWKLAAAAASVAALTFVALHEDEIQDFPVKSDRVADIVTSPSPTFEGGQTESELTRTDMDGVAKRESLEHLPDEPLGSGDIDLHSMDMEWLVITSAQFSIVCLCSCLSCS